MNKPSKKERQSGTNPFSVGRFEGRNTTIDEFNNWYKSDGFKEDIRKITSTCKMNGEQKAQLISEYLQKGK